MEVVIAIIGLIGTVAAAVITRKADDERNRIEREKLTQHLKQKFERKMKDQFKPIKVPNGQRKNTILLIGKGRVGKTQLVSYFASSNPQPQKVTHKFSISKAQRTYKDKIVTYYISDYRGQNFTDLIRNFIKIQFVPHTVMRHGDINTLILLVDTVPSEGAKIQPEKTYKRISKSRIRSHVKDWNTFALDAVFALLDNENLNLVCLLINKIDKLKEGINKETEDIILQEFRPLIDSLETRAKGSNASFEVLFCSAYKGTNLGGVNSLESMLNEYSVPREKSQESTQVENISVSSSGKIINSKMPEKDHPQPAEIKSAPIHSPNSQNIQSS